jgi:hypothetical protein
MIVAFVTSITLLPALLALLRPGGERAAVGYSAAAPIDRFLARRRLGVLAVAAAIAVGSLLLLPKLRFDFNPLNLRSVQAESVATLLDLMQSPDTTPNTIEILAPTLGDAETLAKHLSSLPDVNRALTLASFIPAQQDAKLALLGDAAMLLDAALNPLDVKPPPTDEETVRAMVRTAQALTQAAGSAPGGAAATDATRLAKALTILAKADPAVRERAREAIVPGLVVTLAQLRDALQAETVTLASLPADLKRDWMAPDGRARVEVFPRAMPTTTPRCSASRPPCARSPRCHRHDGGYPGIEPHHRQGVPASGPVGAPFDNDPAGIGIAPGRRRTTYTGTADARRPRHAGYVCRDRLAPQFREHHRAAAVVRHRRRVQHLFRDGMAVRCCEPAAVESYRAVLFSALTTGTAFGSLWYSHHPGTASMGKLLALSLAYTLVASLLFLPRCCTRYADAGDRPTHRSVVAVRRACRMCDDVRNPRQREQ